MSADNVVFVLIPGSFSTPSFYHKVATILRNKGYEVQECQLLSAAPVLALREPPAKLQDDAMYIHEVIQAILAKDKSVVVAMNSYGGFPGGEAVKGLSKSERPDGSSAVVGMVYLSSFLPAVGDTLRSMMGDYLFEPVKTGTPGGYMTMSSEAAPAIFSDLPADKQQFYFEQMTLHSSDSFDGKVTHEAYKLIPSYYVKCEADMIVPPPLQQQMIDNANNSGGKVKTVSVPDTGHVSQISQPETIVKVLEEAAGIKA